MVLPSTRTVASYRASPFDVTRFVIRCDVLPIPELERMVTVTYER